VRRRRQSLRCRDRKLEEGDASTRVVTRNQEAHRERPEANDLVGGIHVYVRGVRCHIHKR
jgi:hypothetical protein